MRLGTIRTSTPGAGLFGNPRSCERAPHGSNNYSRPDLLIELLIFFIVILYPIHGPWWKFLMCIMESFAGVAEATDGTSTTRYHFQLFVAQLFYSLLCFVERVEQMLSQFLWGQGALRCLV